MQSKCLAQRFVDPAAADLPAADQVVPLRPALSVDAVMDQVDQPVLPIVHPLHRPTAEATDKPIDKGSVPCNPTEEWSGAARSRRH